ncbi:alpha/beta fold hydrolase, partial [Paraburkholderia sp.]|uniref:alpha/beta fold hydrolase n=1 Tax=Paraburkholderia sp. TaxID=1926495 RepID=UPI003D6F2178
MGGSDLKVPPPQVVTECANSIGPDRRFYATADTVADLDQLRRALGVQKLTLDSASYGTFLAERYAITYPDRVARLVLDSVVPHDNYDPLDLTAFHRAAQVLAMVCADTHCATDPAHDLWQDIHTRHDGPALLDTLSGLTSGAPRLNDLPNLLHQAVQGHPQALDALVAAETSGQTTRVEHLSQGLHAATECQDLHGPWCDAATPVAGRAAATAAAVAALPPSVLYP